MIWHNLQMALSGLAKRLTAWIGQDESILKDQVQQRALDLTLHLKKGEWEKVRQQFILPLQWILLEKIVKGGWAAVCTTAGSPQEIIGDPVVTSWWVLTTVKVPLQFSRAKLVMTLLIVPTGGLIGLNFAPYLPACFDSNWQTSMYVKPDLIREEAIELGSRGNTVGATFTLPSSVGQYPCVILISGSGPCDRDSTVGASKPFKDVAMGLASNGIAVLRFEKATFAYQRRFRKTKANTLDQEYMVHALAAVRYCTQRIEVLPNRIYILGHSLGAWVTPRIAVSEAAVAGCIIMAGPTQPYYHNAIRQLRYLYTLEGSPQEHIAEQIHELETQAALADSSELDSSTPSNKLPLGLEASYWLSCRSFHPIETCQQMKKPALFLQGERDYQVTVEDDFSKWRSGLREKHDAEFKIYEDLNHLFISGTGPPGPSEYGIPGHVDERVIQDISAWIHRGFIPE